MDACLGFFPTGRVSHPRSVEMPSLSVPAPCPSDTVSGCGGAATPATAGPAAAATTTECSWDATDNGDTDLDAAAVEEVALGAERQFAPPCDIHSNRPSDFSRVIPNADSNGQTSPTPIPSLDGSDDSHASSTPAM
jgi:hypothetical protein